MSKLQFYQSIQIFLLVLSTKYLKLKKFLSLTMGEYVLPKVKARYKYTRQNEDELQFDKGAIIQVILYFKLFDEKNKFFLFLFL